MSHRIAGSDFDTMSRETSQPAASKALPTDLVPQKSSRSLGIFKEQDHRDCDNQEDSRCSSDRTFFLRIKKGAELRNEACTRAQTNAKKIHVHRLGALPLLGPGRQPRAAPQGPRACGGPARVADGQAVGRAL